MTSNDVRAIAPIVDEFVTRHSLDVPKASPQHGALARELLKVEMIIAKEIKQRVQWEHGEYGGMSGGGGGVVTVATPGEDRATVPPVTGMLLSEATAAYLEHFAKRAPATIASKKMASGGSSKILGDRPVQTITKQDCIVYRDTLGQLPSNMARQFPGLSIREVLAKTKGNSSIQRISQQTVNMDLTHLNHLFTYLTDEGQYHGPQTPVRRLAYVGLDENHYEEFTDV